MLLSTSECRRLTGIRTHDPGVTLPQVKREHTPLLAILTNRQVLIVVGTFFSHSWLYYALIITLPMFLKETMDVNLTEVSSPSWYSGAQSDTQY